MKSIPIILAILVLPACSAIKWTSDPGADAQSSQAQANEDCSEVIQNEMDEYIQVTVRAECVRPRADEGIIAFPRIMISKATQKRTYQVYIQARLENWVFLESYRFLYKGVLQPVLPLKEIDRDVSSYSGKVSEHYLFEITKAQFQFFTKEAMKLRLYGKRGQETLEVSTRLFSNAWEAANF